MFVMKPRDYQQECFDKFKDEKYGGIFLPMGTGKSAIDCALVAHKYGRGEITGWIIFSNKGSYRTWDTEQIPLHLFPNLPRQVVHWDAATNNKRVKDFQKLYDRKNELKILIINIEAVQTKRSSALAEALKFIKFHKTKITVDESSTIKNLSSNRTDNIISLGEKSAYRFAMTGSAITNSPMDVWSQCQFLDPYALGYNSFYAFRGTFCDLAKDTAWQRGADGKPRQQAFIKVVGFKRLNDLRDLLDKFCYIKSKDQCLDLPPKVYMKHWMDMGEEQEKMYKLFKKEAIMMINDSTVSATVVLAQLTKLRQIACGYVKSDDGEVHLFDDQRVKELLKILEETDQKVIIWSCFVPSIKMIERAVKEEYGPESYVTYYGETDGADRPEHVYRFQNDPNCRFFIGNPSVGGYGVNATAATVVIYFNNDYSFDKRSQSEDRAHRLGQEKSVTYIDMLARKTLDLHILEVLESKKDVASLVLGDKKKALELLKDVPF